MRVLRPLALLFAFSLAPVGASAAPFSANPAAPADPAACLAAVASSRGTSSQARAIESFIVSLQAQVPPSQWTRDLSIGGYTVSFATPKSDKSVWDPSYFDYYHPASSVRIKILRSHTTTAGAGVAFVGVRESTPERLARDPYFPKVGLACPVTAIIDFQQGRSGPIAHVRLVDPTLAQEAVAADYTAPLELTLDAAEETWSPVRNFLHPTKNIAESGIATLRPYRADRIPVICVHGLNSEPQTWQDVYNELLADPFIRSRYQFWFFRYPTGNPVPVSAALLRQDLLAIRDRYDPKHRNPNFNQTVVIGHSMGGMLTRMMVTEPGDAYWSAWSTVPFEQANLTPEDRQLLSRVLFFQRVPFISRVVFVSTPHRGSKLAQAAIGDLARNLVRLPGQVAALPARIATMNPNAFRPGTKLEFPTGIDNLKPDNTFVRTYQAQPVLVPHHSIIGDRGIEFRGKPESDGVVPYWSSHLDTAESEVVVPWSHSAHTHKRAIAEIRRILLMHAGATN